MMISTKGRYALRILLDLASSGDNGYIAMKTVAERQGLSLKYIEKIMPVLSKNGFVEGIHGKGGGYRLAKSPADCRVGDILRLSEGGLAPVSCSQCNGVGCQRADKCQTLPMWLDFHNMVNNYFDSITLSDLMNNRKGEIVL